MEKHWTDADKGWFSCALLMAGLSRQRARLIEDLVDDMIEAELLRQSRASEKA